MKGPGGYGGRTKSIREWEEKFNPEPRKKKRSLPNEIPFETIEVETTGIGPSDADHERAIRWNREDLACDPERDKAVQLLQKHIDLNENQSILCVECGGGWIQELCAKKSSTVQSINSWRQDHEASKDRSKGRWEEIVAMENDVAEQSWDLILLRQQRSQERNLSWIQTLTSHLRPNGECWIFGENDEGIKGLQHKLERSGYDLEVLAVGKGSRLLVLRNASEMAVAKHETKQWFNHQVSVWPGIFAGGKTDEATALLLKHLPKCQGLKICDLGCGAGVISAYALQHGAEAVHAVDAFLPAVRTCRQIQSPKLQVDWDFMGQNRLRGDADLVLTNPPFHQEHRTAQEIPKRWLSACARAVKPGGAVYLVAHHHLGYTTLAIESGWTQVEEIAKSGPFRLIRMVRLEMA